MESLNHEMKVVDDVLPNFGSREEEGDFSSRVRCCLVRVAAATFVCVVIDVVGVAMMVVLC